MILNFLLVFLGGGLGGLARWRVLLLCNTYSLALGTLSVNTLGCFLVATLTSFADSYFLQFALGFLGGFTTVSGFALDALKYFNTGFSAKKFLSIFLTPPIVLFSTYLGLLVA